MRIIITGGTGLIGTQLAQAMAADGHEIIVLSRNPDNYTFPVGVTGVQWDGQTAVGWAEWAESADAIVNLAGQSIGGEGFPPPRWTAERKNRILQSRLDAGQAVAAAVKQAAIKPKMVVQMSGIDYYGHVAGDTEISEEAPKGNGFLSDVTVGWENATAPVEQLGVRRVILRTAIVLSMAGGPLPQTILPFKFFVGGPLGNGRQWWPWVHLDDVVGVIRYCIENESMNGVYNLCSPNPLPQKDFAKVIGKVMGRPSFIPAPAFALKLMLGEAAMLVLDGRRAIPKRLSESEYTWKYPKLEEALLDLLNR